MSLTTSQRADVANEITRFRHQMATYASDQQFQGAYWQLRYGDQGRITCINDNLKNLDVFSLAIRNNSPMIADTHALWLRETYLKLGMCTTYLIQALGYMQTAAQALLPPATAQELNQMIELTRRNLVYQNPASQELAKHQDAIVEVVTDNMYRTTPFWRVRFGERGRHSCKIDTYYNIAYLSDAIGADNTQGILIHTAWMKKFLLSRGMTSRYYLEAWRELAQTALSMLSPEHHAVVKSVYQQVISNLRYPHDFAQLIENQENDIVSATLKRHYDQDAPLQARLSRLAYRQQVQYTLSYVVDATVHDNPKILSDYMVWLRESALELNFTQADINASLHALEQSLPASTPPIVRQRLMELRPAAPDAHAQAMQAQIMALHPAVWAELHHTNAIWSHLLPATKQVTWRSVLQTLLLQTADGFSRPHFAGELNWVLQQSTPNGASRAYLLALVSALQHQATKQLAPDLAQAYIGKLLAGLSEITDPALDLLQTPDLVAPILDQLQGYSPYWQINYQRRSRASISGDILTLLGFLSDGLMRLTDTGLPAYADLQRRYLHQQGICTAYYQQMLDLITPAIEPLVDADTYERAVIELDAANAALESDDELVLELAQHQDEIVEFVIQHLSQKHPAWVSAYPGGWDDARTDLYYWLGYLTDALTFQQPQLLANHIAWLYNYSRRDNPNETIRTSLIALGHAIKMYLPASAKPVLGIMSASLNQITA